MNATTKNPFDLLNEFMRENPRGWSWETIGSESRYIKTFLRWLKDRKIHLSDVELKTINKFTQHLVDEKFDHETRYHIRLAIFYFIEWAYQKDHAVQDPRILFPTRKPRSQFLKTKLPDYALEFIELASTRVKPSTLSSYRTAIRHFHRFLSEGRIRIRSVDRRILERFFKYLRDRNQGPNTRIAVMVQVRLYLMWLRERGLITCDAEALVKWDDMPKRPEYLPRPLPPKVDRLIQNRLAKSKDLYHKGLLLMRWTGIRVGELSNLNFNALKTTHDGHKFLRVPLGKLNNERLVPIDKKAVDLFHEIQQHVYEAYGATPDHLLVERTGKKARPYLLMHAFKEVSGDISTGEPIVTHRLRHTYATEMLSAGMNIWALKDILGHRDIKMTLRYAAVTQVKVREEYFAALKRMKNSFPSEEPPPSNELGNPDYIEMLKHLNLEVQKLGPAKGIAPKRLLHLTKRISRLKKDLETVLN
jgi:site-specific recombinase XerD